MALSPRERTIAVVVGGVVGLFLIERMAVAPYVERRRELSDRIAAQEEQVAKAKQLFAQKKQMDLVWRDLKAGGLRSDSGEADSQLSHVLTDWTRETGFSEPSYKTEYLPPTKTGFIEIKTQVQAKGPLASLAQMLWRLETATIPVRVNDMTVSTPDPGRDQLQVQLGISTLSIAPAEMAKTDRVRADAGRTQ
jgi:hypothetical protein